MQESINFKYQNLNLDYLTLNIPNSVGRISEFAEIFFRYGFNSKVFYVATNESQIILEAFAVDKEDAFWLKLYHLTVEWNINDLNIILDRQKKRLKDEEEED